MHSEHQKLYFDHFLSLTLYITETFQLIILSYIFSYPINTSNYDINSTIWIQQNTYILFKIENEIWFIDEEIIKVKPTATNVWAYEHMCRQTFFCKFFVVIFILLHKVYHFNKPILRESDLEEELKLSIKIEFEQVRET